MKKTISILDYQIYNDDVQKIKVIEDKKIIINTINPHSYIVAKSNKLFKKALNSSDILLADGVGISLMSKLLKGKKINIINGPFLFNYLINNLNSENRRVFFLGSSQLTLDRIKMRLSLEYPNIKSGFYSPPFKNAFNDEDNDKMKDSINDFKPDVLFVGMTAPKQESWVYTNKNDLKVKMICSIGAVFDFYAGTVKMPKEIWVKLKLIWFIRFLHNPTKLWRRNFISTPLFILDIFLIKLKLKK